VYTKLITRYNAERQISEEIKQSTKTTIPLVKNMGIRAIPALFSWEWRWSRKICMVNFYSIIIYYCTAYQMAQIYTDGIERSGSGNVDHCLNIRHLLWLSGKYYILLIT